MKFFICGQIGPFALTLLFLNGEKKYQLVGFNCHLAWQIARFTKRDAFVIIISHLLSANMEICIFVNERLSFYGDQANCYSKHALPCWNNSDYWKKFNSPRRDQGGGKSGAFIVQSSRLLVTWTYLTRELKLFIESIRDLPTVFFGI